VRAFLRVRELSRNVAAKVGRLLRVLFLRLGQMSADSIRSSNEQMIAKAKEVTEAKSIF